MRLPLEESEASPEGPKSSLNLDGAFPGTDSGQTLVVKPLLVWIDDHPINNTYEVALARGMGIEVIELGSTAMAKSWIEENSGFVRDNNDASRLRFISNNLRTEVDNRTGRLVEAAAGESFLRFIREYGLKVIHWKKHRFNAICGILRRCRLNNLRPSMHAVHHRPRSGQ